MSNFKKTFTIAVSTLTAVWSVGVAALPLSVHAAAMPGDLIKMAGNSAVYYFDGTKRFVFPNQTTYMSWYADFSTVKTISQAELSSYPLGGNITMRPGSWLVKITTVPTVYAVTPGGVLHAIPSEAVAAALYGPNWNKMIVDVADAFFFNYQQTGSAVTSSMYPDGTIIKYANSSTYYYVSGSQARPFASSAALAANGIQTKFAVTTTLTVPTGTSITGSETGIASLTTGTSGNVLQPSNITASLSADTPAANTIVSGQATADLAHFTFTGTGTISQIMLQRIGISSNTTVNNVYLYSGTQRVTDAASINTASQIAFNNMNLAVNGSLKISVQADIAPAANAGSTVGVSLTSFTPLGSAAVTSNLSGNLFSVSNGAGLIAGVNFVAANLVPAPNANPQVNAGSNAYSFWQIPVQVNTHSVWLKSANFQVIGSAPADALSNIQFYVNGVPAGSPVTVQNGYAFFDMSGSPVSLSTGSTTLEVRANIQKGSNRSVQFALQNAADLVVTDSQLNVNVAATVGGVAFAPLQAGLVTISAGTLTSVIDPAFQSMTNVTGGATNTVIGRYKMHAYGEDIKVMTLTLTPAIAGPAYAPPGLGGGVAGSMNNVALYFGPDTSHLGQVGSSQNFVGPALPFNLGSSMIAPAGQDSYLEIRADLQTNNSVNYTGGIVTTAVNFAASNGQGMSSLNTGNIFSPAGVLATTGLTVQTGALVVARSSYSNQTLGPNTTNQKIAEFNLQNQSTSEAIRVTSLAVGLTTNGVAPLTALTAPLLTNFSNLKTDETSGSGSTPINPTANNNFSVNFTINPGQSKSIAVYGDLSNYAGGNTFVVTMLPTAYGVNSNVVLTPALATLGQTIQLAAAVLAAPTFQTGQSTTAQFVAAAGGAASGSSNVWNMISAGGTAAVSELKFVVRGTATVSALGSVATVTVGAASAPVVPTETDRTTLAGAMLIGDLVANMTSGTGVVAGSVLVIDNEQILVTDSTIVGAMVITRGYNGTAAAGHLIAAPVSVINGVAYLTGLGLTVPNGAGGLNVTATPTYTSVGANGIATGTLANLSLGYIKYNVGGATVTKCVASLPCGAGPGTTVLVEQPSATMYLTGSKPSLSATTQNYPGLVVGQNHLFDVTLVPDAKGNITLTSIQFSLQQTNITGASTIGPELLEINGVQVPGSVCNAAEIANAFPAGAPYPVNCVLPLAYVLQAGQATTFQLFATLGGTFGVTANSTTVTTSLDAAANFVWQDTAGNSAANIGGANTVNLYNYPTQTWSVHN